MDDVQPIVFESQDLGSVLWSWFTHHADSVMMLVVVAGVFLYIKATHQRPRTSTPRPHSRGFDPAGRDPQRFFTDEQRYLIHSRAGGRCEAGWQGQRCTAASEEADHIMPHAHGGRTVVSNGQALCQYHNRSKSATIPTAAEVADLEVRRASYFPRGAATTVGPGY